ncbi:oxidoreductase [Corticibacter populi]|uniref:Oxidoreductase n=1 Tax=Corticibacter populi TaxID=1550736 RepID=A0A3M6QX69_9BURK|nr:PDR/VanB family oxidoreductase [Corticibacter populi]RMX07598.1 oxidoreductase [Corticibacter populi]RZS30096.1 vanillate O-demethylase ferredoxin subunit [Corticibacter populi]
MNDTTLHVRVAQRQMATADIVVLDLEPADGSALPAFDAGAHIDLHLPGGLVRQYSLCSDPADTRAYRVGILRDPASRGGSVAVHEQLEEGSALQISTPRNLFPLEAGGGKSYLFGGGIGITPMIAMAHSLHHAGRDFELHYCSRSPEHSAFLAELAAAPFADKVFTHFDQAEPPSPADVAALLAGAGADSHVYVCGPNGFMDWVMETARASGFAPARIHHEYFQVEVETGGAGFEVVAEASGKEVTVGPDETIAQALGRIGIRVQMSCEQGVCGTCMCTVLEGIPDHRDSYQTDEEKAENDQIAVCCSRALTPRLVLDI